MHNFWQTIIGDLEIDNSYIVECTDDILEIEGNGYTAENIYSSLLRLGYDAMRVGETYFATKDDITIEIYQFDSSVIITTR